MCDCDCEKMLTAKIDSLLQRIDGLEKLTDSKFTATHLAVEKAEKATELRFQSVNEFRQALTDQTATFVTRDIVDSRLGEVERRLGGVENRLSVLDGRVIGWSAGVGAVVLLIALISQYLSLGG